MELLSVEPIALKGIMSTLHLNLEFRLSEISAVKGLGTIMQGLQVPLPAAIELKRADGMT